MPHPIPDTQSRTEGGPPDSGFLPCGCHSEPRYRWYVVRTEAGQERLAAFSMLEAGLTSWVPLYADAKSDRIRPLFPRYAFAQFDRRADLWRRIYRARGVETILGMMPGKPDPVPNAALSTLWRQCGPDGVIYPEPERRPSRGDRVRVTSGPFAGLEGIACRSSWDRVSVLMSLLQGERLVSLPMASVSILR